MALKALLASVSLLPGFVPFAHPAGGGTLLTGVFPDARAPAPLQRGYVYLPPSFTRANRYPVAYLLHGIPGSASQYVFSLDLAGWASPLIAAGALRPFIGIVPAAGTHGSRYAGEWAGPWESYVVHGVVPWVDAHLPTIASSRGRVLAGLSAGGFGAFDIGLRHPRLFGRLASWSGYFHPLRDAPFKLAPRSTLRANDPRLLVRNKAARLRREGMRFFVSTGPLHSYLDSPLESFAFAAELRRLRLPVQFFDFPARKGHWRGEFQAGMRWAFGR